MMPDYDFFSLKPIKNRYKNDKLIEDGVLNAANHNKRSLQNILGPKPHIQAGRTPLNYALHGPTQPVEIVNYVNSQIALAGIKPQKNNIMLISVIFSLPVTWRGKDCRQYFEECYQWALRHFDCELVSFDVHHDESAPHAHALLLPIMEDKATGILKLSGSRILGGMASIYAHRDAFFNAVASKYGFKQKKQRLTSDAKEALAEEIIRHATNIEDPMLKSKFFQVIRDKLYEDPEPFARVIGYGYSAMQVKSALVKDYHHK